MKKTLILMMLALMYLSGTLIAQDIIFVTPDGRDSVNVDWLNSQGYNVTVWFPTDGFATAPQSDIDILNAADLIIFGRSCPSTTFQAPHKKRWNDLTAPVLSINMWGSRSSRINWFNSTATSQITTPVDDTLYAMAVDPADPVWAGVTLVGDSLPWARIPEDNIADVNPTNGTVVAEHGDIKYVVRWDPYNEFYPGSGDRPQGYRTYFGMGNDSNGDTAHFFTLTDVAKTVYKAEIDRLISLTLPDNILFITPDGRDSVNIDFLNSMGYPVRSFWAGDLTQVAQDTVDFLNSADLIILGRSCPSTTFQAPKKEVWNSLKPPILSINMWGSRSSRINWFNSTATSQITTPAGDTLYAIAQLPADPVFAGVTLVGDSLPWARLPEDNIADVNENNGTVVAANGDIMYDVRWDPYVPFYPGTIDRPMGYRTYFGMGNDSNGDTAHFFTLTEMAQSVYMAEIDRLLDMGRAPTYIILITPDGRDSVQVDALLAEGYVVDVFWPGKGLSEVGADTINYLNNADVIVVGRSCPSTTFQAPDKVHWNALKAPIMWANGWGARSSRVNMFNSTNMTQATTPVGDTLYAQIADPSDDVFADVTLVGDSIPWSRLPDDYLSLDTTTNGTILASNGDIVYMARFNPLTEYYDGAGDYPSGYRTYAGMGNDSNGDTNHFWTLTDMAQSVYFNELDRLALLPDPALSNDADLMSLEASEGTLVPDFDPAVTEYTLDVTGATVTLTAMAHPNASVAGDGEVDAPGTATITVTADDGSTQDYVVTITSGGGPITEIVVVGDATPNGWNMPSTEIMTQDATNASIFTWEGVLMYDAATESNLKFATYNTSDWCGQWILATAADQSLDATDYQLYQGCPPTEDDLKWHVTAETAGLYLITIDVENETIVFELLTGIIDNEYSNISVYPNPASSSITMVNAENLSYVAIFNLAGERVLEMNVENANGIAEVNISALPAGFYLIRAYDDENLIGIGKFTKQ